LDGQLYRSADALISDAALSKGFPGGPQAGIEYAARKRDLAFEAEIMPAVRQKMQAGDRAGAVDQIEASQMSQYGKTKALQALRYVGAPVRDRRANPQDFGMVNDAGAWCAVNSRRLHVHGMLIACRR
jgi:hypothetical protein